MKTIPLAICFLIASCGPTINLQKGTMSAGFMSKTQAFAGKMKTANGSASWSIVGTDSTEVPIAGINGISTAISVTATAKGLMNRQNNDAAVNTAKVKANSTPVTPTITPEGAVVPPVFPPQQ